MWLFKYPKESSEDRNRGRFLKKTRITGDDIHPHDMWAENNPWEEMIMVNLLSRLSNNFIHL